MHSSSLFQTVKHCAMKWCCSVIWHDLLFLMLRMTRRSNGFAMLIACEVAGTRSQFVPLALLSGRSDDDLDICGLPPVVLAPLPRHPDVVPGVGEVGGHDALHVGDQLGQRVAVLLHLALHGQDLAEDEGALTHVLLHRVDVLGYLRRRKLI